MNEVKKSKTSRQSRHQQNLLDDNSDKSMNESRINLLSKKGSSKTEIITSPLKKSKQKTFIGPPNMDNLGMSTTKSILRAKTSFERKKSGKTADSLHFTLPGLNHEADSKSN